MNPGKICLTAVLACAATSARAFEPPTRFSVFARGNSYDVLADDFDVDGDVDLWIVNEEGLDFLANDGTGAFLEGVPGVYGDLSYFEVAHGDFDGDGHLDFVFVDDFSQSQLNIAFGKAGGIFEVLYRFPMIGGATAVAVADFDGDGFDDAVTTHTGPMQAVVHFSDGARGIRERVGHSVGDVGEAVSDVAIGDVTGDGILDIITPRRRSVDPGIVVLVGADDGTFTRIDVPAPALRVALRDFDGDGRDDIVTNDENGVVRVVRYDGVDFAVERTTLDFVAHYTLIGDFDGDGDADLMLPHEASTTQVTVLLNDGAAGFDARADFVNPHAFFEGIAAGDLDGNGVDDVISLLGREVSVWLMADQTVASTTTVAVTPASASHGVARTVSVEVVTPNGAAEGPVVIEVDGVEVDVVDLEDGVATATIDGGAVGAHTLVARYDGAPLTLASSATTTFETSARSCTVEVVVAPPSAPLNESRSLTITVRGSGVEAPTGPVTFDLLDGILVEDVTLGPDGSREVFFSTWSGSPLQPGFYPARARYAGDALHGACEGETIFEYTRVATTTSVDIAPRSALVGEPRVITVSVADNRWSPGGTVALYVDEVFVAVVALVDRSASFTYSGGAAGAHSLVARYGGDARNAPSSAGTVFESVARPTTIVASTGLSGLTLRPHATLTETTTGAPIAGRSVRISAGSQAVCTATTNASGRAECAASVGSLLALILGGGTDATFDGDATYAPSTDHAGLFE